MIKQYKFLTFLPFLLWISLHANGDIQHNPFDWMAHHNWSVKEGMPSNVAAAVVVDKNRYVWTATKAGLVRFDGRNFRIFDRSNTPAFINHCTQKLYIDPEGTLWIGSAAGLLYLEREKIRMVPGTEKLSISSMLTDRSGNLWFGSYNQFLYRLIRKDGKTFLRKYGKEKGMTDYRVLSLLMTRMGKLWLGSKHQGLFGYDAEKDRFMPEFLPGLKEIPRIYTMAEASDGTLWIGIYRKGLLAWYPDGTTRLLTETDGLSDNRVIYLYPEPASDSLEILWVGTSKGISRLTLKDGQISRIDRSQEDRIVIDFKKDEFGRIWFGTKTKGLNCLEPVPYRQWDRMQGLGNVILDLHKDHGGRVWISVYEKEIFYFEDHAASPFIPKNQDLASLLKGEAVMAIGRGNGNRLYFGTGIGLVDTDTDGTSFRILTESDGLPDRQISSLLMDQKNRLWIGSYGGISRLDPELKRVKVLVRWQEKGYKRAVFLETANQMLIGTNRGLYRFSLSDRSGIYEQLYPEHHITSLTAFPDEKDHIRILIGTKSKGLFELKRKGLKALHIDDSFPPKQIRLIHLTTDSTKNRVLWIAGSKGIYSIPWVELERGRKNKIRNLLHHVEFQPSAIQLKDSGLLLASREGLVAVDEELLGKESPMPMSSIESIFINGERIARDSLSLRPKFSAQNSIGFRFCTAGYLNSQNISYRYRIKGESEKTHLLAPNRDGRLDIQLSTPGMYTLQVKASVAEVIQQNWTEFSFQIQSSSNHWLLLTGILFLMVIGLLFFIRKRKTLRKSNRKTGNGVTDDPVKLDEREKERLFCELYRLLEDEKLYRNENLLVQSLSEQMEIPAYLLSKLIKERYQQNFSEFINGYRVREAADNLKNPSMATLSILQIATDAGFNNKTTFNHAFKKTYGMTPSQYRKKI